MRIQQLPYPSWRLESSHSLMSQDHSRESTLMHTAYVLGGYAEDALVMAPENGMVDRLSLSPFEAT